MNELPIELLENIFKQSDQKYTTLYKMCIVDKRYVQFMDKVEKPIIIFGFRGMYELVDKIHYPRILKTTVSEYSVCCDIRDVDLNIRYVNGFFHYGNYIRGEVYNQVRGSEYNAFIMDLVEASIEGYTEIIKEAKERRRRFKNTNNHENQTIISYCEGAIKILSNYTSLKSLINIMKMFFGQYPRELILSNPTFLEK